MLALALALSVTLQPALGDIAPGQANRSGVGAALASAQVAVDRIGHCSRERPDRDDWDQDYDAVLRRLADIFSDAGEVYADVNASAVTMDSAIRTAEAPAPNCADDAVRADLAQAGRALDEATALIRADAPPRTSGLWLGTLRLCGDRVESVEEGEPEFEGGPRPVNVRFSSAFAPRVRALTAAFVGRRLPIVLDGTVVVRPTVNEPISYAVSISAPDRPPVEHFRRAAASSC